MRSFKLKKTYPGCMFKVGDIQKVELSTYSYYTNYPDNWEEIIDKEYEILKYRYNEMSDAFPGQIRDAYKTTDKGVQFSPTNGVDNWGWINKRMHVYSIKCLSDGEIFSVGDEFSFKDARRNWKIESFTIDKNNKPILNGIDTRCVVHLDSAIKVVKKEPLFISSDGVPIFDKVGYYYIFDNTKVIRDSKADEYYRGKYTGHDRLTRFSTKEAAQEWLDKMYPKPILTTVDGKECFEGDKVYILYRSDETKNYNFLSHQPIAVQKCWVRPTKTHLDFSTREVAEQYLIENTVLFSLNDIMTMPTYGGSQADKARKEWLIAKSKEKLNIK